MGPYEVGDTTPFTVPGPGGEDPGLVSFTKGSKYLGSIVSSSLTLDADVGKRIKSVAAVFETLWSVLRNFTLERGFRGEVYSALALTALLNGSKVRCLHGDLLVKLRSSHNTCVGSPWRKLGAAASPRCSYTGASVHRAARGLRP